MPKIDKSLYTKSEWLKIKKARASAKAAKRHEKEFKQKLIPTRSTDNYETVEKKNESLAFVCGNGTSRKMISIDEMKKLGKVYGCNALYREYRPDYLIAVDTRMVLEITKTGWHLDNPVYTNPNRSYKKMEGLNLFNPSKGWSSGPTALWLASKHTYETIYILGFDYKGIDKGRWVNNIYANTINYKKQSDRATFYGNWLKQTQITVKENEHINYVRVIDKDGFIPKELINIRNLRHMYVDEFVKIHNLT